MRSINCTCGRMISGISDYKRTYVCDRCDARWSYDAESDVWHVEMKFDCNEALLETVNRHIGYIEKRAPFKLERSLVHVKGELKKATNEKDIDRLLDEYLELESQNEDRADALQVRQ